MFIHTSNTSISTTKQAIEFLLKQAKKIHRTALTRSTSQALPILRRLLINKILINISLVELNKNKTLIKRKHILQLFAAEAGYQDWGTYRKVLTSGINWQDDNYISALRHHSYPNLWFSTLVLAQEYVSNSGGRAIKMGTQAVVLID